MADLRTGSDRGLGDFEQGGIVAVLNRCSGEGLLCLHISWVDASGVTEVLLGGLQIAFGLGGAAKPELDGKAVGIGLGGFLEEGEGVVRLAVVEEQHAVENGDLGQAAVGFGEFSGDGSGLGDVVFQNEDASIGELDGSALGMLGDEVGVGRLGAVELIGADVIVGEKFCARIGVGEVVGGLMEGCSALAVSFWRR